VQELQDLSSMEAGFTELEPLTYR